MAREVAQVGVETGGGRVVVAGSEVNVAADAVVLPADHERCLAVGLEADDAVDHVHAGFLKHPGLVDVVLFIKPSLKLHQSGHLLAVLGSAGQSTDDRDWILPCDRG